MILPNNKWVNKLMRNEKSHVAIDLFIYLYILILLIYLYINLFQKESLTC